MANVNRNGFDCVSDNSSSNQSFVSYNKFAPIENCVNDMDLSQSEWSQVIHNRKRSRVNTGSPTSSNTQSGQCVNIREYEALSTDDKLSVMFLEINNIKQDVSSCLQIHNKVQSLENCLSEHDKRFKLLEYKSIDIEARSRRNNLIFGGIPEEKNERCSDKIAVFLKDHMQIDPCPAIPRAHRLGRFKENSTRAIIVYFLDYRDTEKVLSNAKKLKNTDFHVNRDYPREIVDARKALWSKYKSLRGAHPESVVSIVYPAKLVVDGRVVADMFPDWNFVMQGSRTSKLKSAFANAQYTQPSSANIPRDSRADKSRPPDDNTVQERSRKQSSSVKNRSRRTESKSLSPQSRQGRRHAPVRPASSHPGSPGRNHQPQSNMNLSQSSQVIRPWDNSNVPPAHHEGDDHEAHTDSQSQ